MSDIPAKNDWLELYLEASKELGAPRDAAVGALELIAWRVFGSEIAPPATAADLPYIGEIARSALAKVSG